MTVLRHYFLLFSLPLFLCSCSWTQNVKQNANNIELEIKESVNDGFSEIRGIDIIPVLESSDSYLGSKNPVLVKPEKPELPEELFQTISLNFVDSLSLRNLCQILASETGLNIKPAPEIKDELLNNLLWSGTVLDLLDHLSAQLSTSWQFKQNRITLFRTQLRVWYLHAAGVHSQWSSTVGLAAVTGDGGSSLSSKDRVIVQSNNADFWPQVTSLIENLLSPFGKATISAESGEIAVIDTLESLERIDQWIMQKNKLLASQVLISVDLYEIQHSENVSSGFSLDGFIDILEDDAGLKIETAIDEFSSVATFTYFEPANVEKRDISAIIRASAGDNRVSKLTSSIVRGLNGYPIPVFFGDEESYLKQREVVQHDGHSAVRLIPGTLQDGVSLNLVPRILSDTDRLILHATVRTTNVKSINQFPSDAGPDDAVIQLPDLESRSILIPVLLRSGETLVVAGLDTVRSNGVSNRGIFSKKSDADTTKSSLLLLITPRIISPGFETTHFPARRNL